LKGTTECILHRDISDSSNQVPFQHLIEGEYENQLHANASSLRSQA
jgi:hypothetical protein